MRFKSKFYILYLHGMENDIQWPEGWGNHCRGNLATMISEILDTGAIAGELKLIWNEEHRRRILEKYQITGEQLDCYLKAETGSLHFGSEGTRRRAVKALEKMGAKDLVMVDSYREVLLYQAHFQVHGKFPEPQN